MRKSIVMYPLLALGYLVFSTLLFTEVSAQTIAITITAGNNQSTTRGKNFPNPVTVNVTGLSGTAILLFSADSNSSNLNLKVSQTADGTFIRSTGITMTADGNVNFYVKADQDSLYDTGKVRAHIATVPDDATFTGTITDVLNFSTDTTTRSVKEGTTVGTNIGAPVSATHWANADTDTSNNVTLEYSFGGGTDDTSFSIDSSTGQLRVKNTLGAVGTTYSVKVKVEEKDGTTVRSSDTIDVTISVILLAAPTNLRATPGDGQVTLNWDSPSTTVPITGYEYTSDDGANWISTGNGTTPSIVVTSLANGRTYTFKVRAVSGSIKGTASAPQTVELPPLNAGISESLTVRRIDSRTVKLCWDIPTTLNVDTITGYQYSTDGGQTWTSTGSMDTCITLTGDGLGALPLDQFKIRAMNRSAGNTRSFAIISARPQPRIILECPVGWQRTDRFAQPTPRVLLYEVKLDMDLQNLVSIYKPDWVAIYVHPDEGLENLEGWKLQVAVPYNLHRDYLLTAENSIVVDAGFVEGGFAFIENPEEDPFPMIGMGFTGATVPGFDYRLYDETGRKVDFGIACYKRGGIFQALKDMEDPRVLRNVLLESLDWDSAIYIRSEWTVPAPAPAAPSLVKKTVVGTWAALKKR